MIVAERQAREVAVKIENDVAINIHKEVALALLSIDEALHLLFKLVCSSSLPDKFDPSCMTGHH